MTRNKIKTKVQHSIHKYLEHSFSFLLQKLEPASSIEKRMGSTRVDTDELIEEIIRSTDLQADDSAEGRGFIDEYR